MDKEKQNNQFHPPACAALELEFRENRDDLEFTPELQLNKLPNRVDVVVVKKSADAVSKADSELFSENTTSGNTKAQELR